MVGHTTINFTTGQLPPRVAGPRCGVVFEAGPNDACPANTDHGPGPWRAVLGDPVLTPPGIVDHRWFNLVHASDMRALNARLTDGRLCIRDVLWHTNRPVID